MTDTEKLEELKMYLDQGCILRRVAMHVGIYKRCHSYNKQYITHLKWVDQKILCSYFKCEYWKKKTAYHCTFEVNNNNPANIKLNFCKHRMTIAANDYEFKEWIED